MNSKAASSWTPKKVESKEGRISILWNDGHASVYAARDLRLSCRCAGCVDEWSHASLIKPELVPLNITPKGIQAMGNYALHFDWSDGHNTGIYTYDYLREVCGCEICKS